MPDHVRKQIRDAVKAKLTGLATSADRVYTGRTRRLPTGHLPTLLVYTSFEESRRDANGNPPILARALTVYVEAKVSTADTPDDLLDLMSAEVEAAMRVDVTLGGLVFNLQFVGTQQASEAQGESQIGGSRLEYRATYRTREGLPNATA
jgi:hypothetical protein